MRTRLILISAAAVLVVLALAVLILSSNVDKYRPRVQKEMQSKLNRPVTLGHLGLRLFPLSIRVNDVTIGEAPEFHSSRPFATAKELFISVGLFSLIGGNPEVKDLSLDNPQIELIKNSAGVWNFSTIGGSAPASTSTASKSGGTTQFSLNKLKIDDGQVGVTDQSTGQPRSVYDHIDLTLTDFAPGKQFGIDLAAHFPGQGSQLLAFKGKAGPLQQANAAATPLTGHVSLKGVSVAGINSIAPGTIPANTDTSASGDADVSSQGAALAAKGDLKLENTTIQGAKLDYPVTAKYDLSMDRAKNLIQIRSGTVNLGSTAFTISGDVNNGATPAVLNVRLATQNSSIAELARLAGAFGGTGGVTGTGKVSADVHAQGAMSDFSKLNLSGTASITGATIHSPALAKPLSIASANAQFSQNSVAISNLAASLGGTAVHGNVSATNFAAPNLQFALAADKIDTADLQTLTPPPQKGAAPAPAAQTKAAPASQESFLNKITGNGTLAANTIKAEDIVLTNVKTNCKLDHGVVALNGLTADIFGGKENGNLTLDLRPKNALCAVNAKFAGVNTNSMLSAISTVKDTLYGSLAATTNLRFALVSAADLPRTLNGTLNFDVTNGQLKHINILDQLSKVGKFLGSVPGQTGTGTDLKQFSGTLNVVNGVATTDNLKAALAAGSLSAAGTMNLVDQGLNMHMSAVMGSGVSQAAGGTKVGGFLNTALANNKGELVIPVIVSGSMSHPVFAPDVQAMAKMKLNHLLPSVGDPSKLTQGLMGGKGAGGILNGVLGGGAPAGNAQANQQKQNNPQDTVNSLLNSFGKKKKKQ